LQDKPILGLVSSSDPHSAVTLEQLQAVVAGDTTDTIVSTDLHSRIKVFSLYAQFTVNQLEAMRMNKPDAQTLELDV
jgi:hypothetical protein